MLKSGRGVDAFEVARTFLPRAVRQALAVAAEAARAARTKHAEVEVPGRPSGDPDHALTDIAIATAALGDFPAAVHIASGLPDELAVRPLAVIARGQAEAGDDAYRETCELALSAARSSATDAHEIARELALAGMGQEAMAAAQLALQQGSFGVKAALARLAEAGDRSSIKQAAALLLAYPGYAEDAVALLARGYPEMTMPIVAAIENVARHGAVPLAQ